jgi:hypothetical protein
VWRGGGGGGVVRKEGPSPWELSENPKSPPEPDTRGHQSTFSYKLSKQNKKNLCKTPDLAPAATVARFWRLGPFIPPLDGLCMQGATLQGARRSVRFGTFFGEAHDVIALTQENEQIARTCVQHENAIFPIAVNHTKTTRKFPHQVQALRVRRSVLARCFEGGQRHAKLTEPVPCAVPAAIFAAFFFFHAAQPDDRKAPVSHAKLLVDKWRNSGVSFGICLWASSLTAF